MAAEVQKISKAGARLKDLWLSQSIDAASLGTRARELEIAARRIRIAAQRSPTGPGHTTSVVAAPANRTIEPAAKDSDLTSEDRAKIYEKRLEDTLATQVPRYKEGGVGAKSNAPDIGAAELGFLKRVEASCADIQRAVSSGAAPGSIDELVRGLPG